MGHGLWVHEYEFGTRHVSAWVRVYDTACECMNLCLGSGMWVHELEFETRCMSVSLGHGMWVHKCVFGTKCMSLCLWHGMWVHEFQCEFGIRHVSALVWVWDTACARISVSLSLIRVSVWYSAYECMSLSLSMGHGMIVHELALEHKIWVHECEFRTRHVSAWVSV